MCLGFHRRRSIPQGVISALFQVRTDGSALPRGAVGVFVFERFFYFVDDEMVPAFAKASVGRGKKFAQILFGPHVFGDADFRMHIHSFFWSGVFFEHTRGVLVFVQKK